MVPVGRDWRKMRRTTGGADGGDRSLEMTGEATVAGMTRQPNPIDGIWARTPADWLARDASTFKVCKVRRNGPVPILSSIPGAKGYIQVSMQTV